MITARNRSCTVGRARPAALFSRSGRAGGADIERVTVEMVTVEAAESHAATEECRGSQASDYLKNWCELQFYNRSRHRHVRPDGAPAAAWQALVRWHRSGISAIMWLRATAPFCRYTRPEARRYLTKAIRSTGLLPKAGSRACEFTIRHRESFSKQWRCQGIIGTPKGPAVL